MLSTPHAKLAIQVLSLLLVAAISFFFLTSWIPETDFVKESMESIEQNEHTVMALSGATLSASLAITVFPDDFATPLANSLSDMNIYFVVILVVLFLERVIVQYGIEIAFAIMIPCACAACIISNFIKKDLLRSFATRLCVLALAIAFVIPCSTHVADYVASELKFTEYVEETITETGAGADKLNQAMNDGGDEKTIFEKLSGLFLTAISGITDLMNYFQGIIQKCINSIAILIMTSCVMPILTFLILKWILEETFHITVPNVSLKAHKQETEDKQENKPERELITAGEE